MRIHLLAYDSMGVRSMAFAVETGEGIIVVDPGASLAPRRFGLPPHDLEWRELERRLDRIRSWIEEAEVVVITHYHYDHYIRDESELYKNKILIIKHPKKNINRSQAIRSYRFLKKEGVQDIAKEVIYGDNQILRLGKVEIDVSPPVWHGYPGTKVGYVVMIRIVEENQSIVYTSDVQGPADPSALKILEEWKEPQPLLVIVDGPPTYFAGFKVPKSHVEAGLKGMNSLIEILKPRTIIVDHHLTRDRDFRSKIQSHIETARRLDIQLVTAAEYMGEKIRLLEAMRRELWRKGD